MQMLIRTNGFTMNNAIKRYITDRVGAVFSRFSGVIRKVEVYVADENGPKGGVDKLCVVKVKLDQSSEVVVKDIESDLYLVIQRALSRAKQSVTKRLNKSKTFVRRRGVTIVSVADEPVMNVGKITSASVMTS